MEFFSTEKRTKNYFLRENEEFGNNRQEQASEDYIETLVMLQQQINF